MSTLVVIDGGRGESRSEAIVRRLKGALAERGVSVAEVARRLGVTQQKLSRRMTGLNPFDIDELDAICRVARIDFDYVVTGIRDIDPDDGGDQVSERSSVQSREGAQMRPTLRIVATR